MLVGCSEYGIFISKGGNTNTSKIRSILNGKTDRVNLSTVNFGNLSTDDRLKGNDTIGLTRTRTRNRKVCYTISAMYYCVNYGINIVDQLA